MTFLRKSKSAGPPLQATKWGLPSVRARNYTPQQTAQDAGADNVRTSAPQQSRQDAGITRSGRNTPQLSRQAAGVTSPDRDAPQLSRQAHFDAGRRVL